MKKYSIITFLFLSVFCFSQQKNLTVKDFYKQNKKQSEFSMGIPMFLGKLFIPKEELNDTIKNLLKDIKHLRVNVFENPKNITANKFKQFISKTNLKRLLKVKENKNNVTIYFREYEGLIQDIVLTVNEEAENFVVLKFKTKTTKEKLASMLQ